MTYCIAGNRIFQCLLFILFTICLGGFWLGGCTTVGSAQSGMGRQSVNRIYQVSTQEAISLSSEVLADVLPDSRVLRLNKPRFGLMVHQTHQSGDAKYARFREKDYIYELDLMAMEGHTSKGERVAGFIFSIQGRGNLEAGPGNVDKIGQRLSAIFEASGRPVAIVAAREADPASQRPTIDQQVPPQVVPRATDPAFETVPADNDTFTKLKKLKELLDEGVITEEEFQLKKKELLERI